MKRKIFLVALLWLVFVNPGGITNIDTERRMQMTHAWWTGTEENRPGDKLVINVKGKNYVPYDLGQSMLMLPADWLGTQLGQNLSSQQERLKLREAIVSFLTFVPINLLAVLSCFQLLKLFGYSEKIAGLSSIVWLLGSSVLYYTTLHQQNNQILLFVVLGYLNALAYVIKEKKQLAIFSGMALGLAFLIRMTSALHIVSVLTFLLGCINYKFKHKKVSHSLKSLGLWMIGFFPIFLIERSLTFYRYGSWTANTISLHLQTFSQRSSVKPDEIVQGHNNGFPFLSLLTKVKLDALLAPLISPEKSIFLYDPLVLPCLILLFLCWKFLIPYIKWYLIAETIDFLLHLYIYSWTKEWIESGYWGPRYHITSIHLWLIPLIPLLVQGAVKKFSYSKQQLEKIVSWVARLIIIGAILIEFSAILLPTGLEINQQMLGLSSSIRPVQRLKNVFYIANYQNYPHPEIAKLIEAKPGFVLDNRITWEILPFRLDNRIAAGSSLKKIIPILYIIWAIIFIVALTMTVAICIS